MTRDDQLSKHNDTIRHEADDLLDHRGLRALLARHGTLHVSGSYALGLMTWRDLDLYLEMPGLPVDAFFELGRDIARLLRPKKMFFTDNRRDAPGPEPHGLYWGTRLGDLRQGGWKIDLWALEPDTCTRLLKRCHDIASRLTPATRNAILDIKSQCWDHPEYRRAFSSMDVYRAVLDEGVADVDEFFDYLNRTGKMTT